MKYLNIYELGEAYGGPEEGGWWYTVGNPVESQSYADEELKRMQRTRQVLNERFQQADSTYAMGYGNHDGINEEGFGDDNFLMKGGVWGRINLTARIEDHPAKGFPSERPYYE